MGFILGINFVLLLFISILNSSNLKIFAREGPSPALERFLKVGRGPYKTISQSVNTVQERMEAFWPMGIVSYYVDLESYDYQVSRRLRIVMNMLETYTCIKFKPLLVKPTEKMSWLHFTNPENKRECSHAPEFHANGTIVMVLGLECLRRQNIIHTLLHAIGLKDEISHPQRDQYVRVLWENINPAYRNLFRIQTEDSATKNMVEYDPMSIMHFHDRAFSLNGHATIAPLIPGLVINPSPDLSQLDKLKLRLIFNHECNKRRVDSLLDKCKNVMRAESSSNANNKDGNEIAVYPKKGDKIDMCTKKSTGEAESVTEGAQGTDEGNVTPDAYAISSKEINDGEKTGTAVPNFDQSTVTTDLQTFTSIRGAQEDVSNEPEEGSDAKVAIGSETVNSAQDEVVDATKLIDGPQESSSEPEIIKSASVEVGDRIMVIPGSETVSETVNSAQKEVGDAKSPPETVKSTTEEGGNDLKK